MLNPLLAPEAKRRLLDAWRTGAIVNRWLAFWQPPAIAFNFRSLGQQKKMMNNFREFLTSQSGWLLVDEANGLSKSQQLVFRRLLIVPGTGRLR